MGFYKTFDLPKIDKNNDIKFVGELDISTHPAMDYPSGIIVQNTKDNRLYVTSRGEWCCVQEDYTNISVEFEPVKNLRGIINNVNN